MPTLTDTHSHIYLEEFDADRTEVVKRALDAGVERMILPCVNVESIGRMRTLAQEYPDHFRRTIGLHPSDVFDNYNDILEQIHDEYESHPSEYIGIGEIGIDLYWDKKFERQQMLALDSQLDWASKYKLPVILHCRDGLDRILEVLQGHKDIDAVFHCFGGSVQDVNAIRRVGDYYFGIGGVLTFKNSKLRDVIPEITLSRIVLETDAPYLAPVPYRGKRNESAYIVATATSLAQTLGMTTDEIALATSANSESLFGF